jgi:nucleoid-associated protein EbfC
MKQFPGGLQNFLKQAQQMQGKMAKVQAELDTKTVDATAGGGAVTATVTCKPSLVSLKISKEAAGDVEMLQDLVTAAVNEALKKAETTKAAEMEKVTGGISLPGLF